MTVMYDGVSPCDQLVSAGSLNKGAAAGVSRTRTPSMVAESRLQTPAIPRLATKLLVARLPRHIHMDMADPGSPSADDRAAHCQRAPRIRSLDELQLLSEVLSELQ